MDPIGSDCGTDKYITVTLTEDNIHSYMYSYIIKQSGSLELLDSKNYNNYIGKTVKMRFSSLCKSTTGICNMCGGDLIYKSVENVGTGMSQIPSTLKVMCLKSFHDSVVNTTKMDPMKAFFPFD